MNKEENDKLQLAINQLIEVANEHIGFGEQDYLMNIVERIEELMKNE